MGAVVSGLPTMGYALEVDGRLKTEFETKEGGSNGRRGVKETLSDVAR